MKSIIVFSILLLFLSCKFIHKEEKIQLNTTVYNWDTENTNPLSACIDSIEYIPLEAKAEIFFKNIDKFIKQGNRYFIFDCFGKNQVIVFDTCGKFLFNVGRKGHGPGEYTRIRNFTVDDEYIYLLNNDLQCIMIYDHDGNYIKQKDIPFIAFDIAVCNNKNFLFSWHQNKGGTDNKELYKIIITDENMNPLKKILPIDENDCEDMSKRYYFTSNSENIIFHNLYNDTFYQFNRQNANLDSIYKINLPAPMIPRGKRKSYENIEGYSYIPQTPFLSSDYMIGQMISQKVYQLYIYHFNDQKMYTHHNSDSLLIYMPLFLNDKELISYLPSYQWYEYATNQGCKRLSSCLEEKLKNGECILVKYKLK